MSGRDIGASVRQRLLNRARAEGRPFQELLQYFAMERFLYRLASSPFADRSARPRGDVPSVCFGGKVHRGDELLTLTSVWRYKGVEKAAMLS